MWYWSKEGLSPYSLTFRTDLKDYPQGTNLLVEELSQMVPQYAVDLVEEFEILKKLVEEYKAEYLKGYHFDYLSRTEDYGERLAPRNFCNSEFDHPLEVANIARYDQRNFFILSYLYFDALSEIEKNGLIFHEVVYRVLEKYNLDKDEAFNTMEVTANMLSNLPEEQKLQNISKILLSK